MSELKAFVARKIDDGTCEPVPCVEVYLKSEVDKVIEDLENFAEDACLERDDNQTAIDELQEENRRLKPLNRRYGNENYYT